jgi:hypothetical protein
MYYRRKRQKMEAMKEIWDQVQIRITSELGLCSQRTFEQVIHKVLYVEHVFVEASRVT